jgi:hypothetical protein
LEPALMETIYLSEHSLVARLCGGN